MNRMWVLFALLAIPAVAMAQNAARQPYQPAVPAATTVNAYGGGWGHSGASTAAGSAMNGMASVISAAGDYNLSTSAAAINMTQAQKNDIENRQQWTNTYFEMRATNKAARAAEAGPRPSMEQLVKIAHDGAPRPLRPSQMDPVSGTLNWPGALQTASFAPQRSEVDQLLAKRAQQGALDYTDQSKVRESIDAMFVQLKAQIREIPPQVYATCRDFLRSLVYAAAKTDL
jgi:hypothetical protein